VRRTVPPSAEIEEQIDRLLAVGVGEHPRESLSELAKLGARLIIQRAVEDEFDAWLGRARYERRPEAPPGLRNGFRARRVQTAEGELEVDVPQVREAAFGLAGRSLSATLVASPADEADERALVDALRIEGATAAPLLAGVTLLDDVLVLRMLCLHAIELRETLERAWTVLRPRILGRPACPPRVWRT
jgi:hypothetical protein